MPIRLNVGLSRKVGLPDYGSLGASCHVEVELDAALLDQDPEAFQGRARQVYAACARAVNEELARQQATGQSETEGSAQKHAKPAGSAGGGHDQSNGNHGNGKGSHPLSLKQRNYINQLANQLGGLGMVRVDLVARKLFGKPMAELTSFEGSNLIDTLKAAKEGHISLDDVLDEQPAGSP